MKNHAFGSVESATFHDNRSDRQLVDRIKKPPAMYKPDSSTGGFMARGSVGGNGDTGRDSMGRVGGTSALSINFP